VQLFRRFNTEAGNSPGQFIRFSFVPLFRPFPESFGCKIITKGVGVICRIKQIFQIAEGYGVRRASVLEQKKDGFGLGLLKILKSLGFY
jgi:hypothetical protein